MTNQEKPDIEKTSKNQVSPLMSLLVIISATFIILAFLNEFAVKTPLVRSFEDGARRAKIAACETKASVENFPPEDCYK